FYIASGASEEIAWVEDFWLPSPANPSRGIGGPPARVRSSTNRRSAEERLPSFRFLSMSATIFDTVAHSACAMSFRTVQNASSRLTLVLCPSITIDRLTIEDFILIGPSLYPVMGVTDSATREQQNTCKKAYSLSYEDFWYGNASGDPLSYDVKLQQQKQKG